MKINADPSAVWFSCNDANNAANERRVALRANGTFTFEVFLNGGGLGSSFMNWDNTPGIHDFALTCNEDVMTLVEDNVELGSWSHTTTFNPERVRFFFREGDSEFADYLLCDITGCDPLPTYSPTTTPSPSPSSTPTPTPMPTPKKVFVIPGMGGSWNPDALIGCKTEGYSGEWTSWTKSDQVYRPVLEGLAEAGYDPIPYYYDWRKQITTTSPLFSSFLQTKLSAEETADIVGHSLGGLVGKGYIELEQGDSKIDKLLTVGSPHHGAVNAYPAWSAGAIWHKDIELRLALFAAQIGCSLAHQWSFRETIQNAIPAVQNILPIFDYLKDRHTGLMKPVTEMYAQNNWQPTFFSPPFYGVTVGTLSGTGHDTLRSLEVVRPLLRDRLEGNWLDGRPNSTRLKEDGDGDVLVESSQIEGAQNITLPLDHGALMANPQGVNTILSFLSDESLLLPLETRTTRHQDISIQNDNASALLIIVQGARATLTDNFGFSEQDSNGQITIIDPHDEPFTLSVQPNRSRWLWWKPKYKIIVAQLFEDGTSIWKEYPQRGSAQRKWNLRFDRNRHSHNLLPQ